MNKCIQCTLVKSRVLLFIPHIIVIPQNHLNNLGHISDNGNT